MLSVRRWPLLFSMTEDLCWSAFLVSSRAIPSCMSRHWLSGYYYTLSCLLLDNMPVCYYTLCPCLLLYNILLATTVNPLMCSVLQFAGSLPQVMFRQSGGFSFTVTCGVSHLSVSAYPSTYFLGGKGVLMCVCVQVFDIIYETFF